MTFIKKATLSLSIAVFATSTLFAAPTGGGGSTGNSGGDDDNTVAIVAGLGALAGVAYLYTTGAFSGGLAGGKAATGATRSAAKMGKSAARAKTQVKHSVRRTTKHSVKRKASTHTHPAIPGVTKSVSHTHMGPMPHTHRYGK